MTTVVYDGKTLVADRQLTDGNRRFPTTKLWRLKDGSAIAGAGGISDILAARDYFNEPDLFDEKPELSNVEMLLVRPDGTVWVAEEDLVLVRVERAYHAIGTGADYALAAMALGCDAARALRTAAIFDVYTGESLDHVEIPARPASAPPF